MRKGFKYVFFLTGSLIVLFFYFIYYASSDNLTHSNILDKSKNYLTLRYLTLTSLFRTTYPEHNLDNVPIFSFDFDENDIKYISKIDSILSADAIYPTLNFDYYNEVNNWRENNLFYEGKKFKIKWKSHGRKPDGHRYRGLISLNIKIIDGQKIYNSDHFRFIIYRRFSSDVKIVEYLAKEFNLITRFHKIIKVKIRGFGNRLFWFEKRYNNKLMREKNLNHLIIISNNKKEHKSNIISNRLSNTEDDNFHINEFNRSIKKYIKKNKLSREVSDSVINIYRRFNKALVSYDEENICTYVDSNYISSYLAARMLSGSNYHGTLEQNLFIYFDTVYYKFYPCFGRDEIFTILKADSVLLTETHYEKSKFITTLLMNNKIRQGIYKKVFGFITKNQNSFTESIYNIIDKHEKRHFPKWVKTTNGLTHLHTIPFINVNTDSILKYLNSSTAKIEYYKSANRFKINFLPNSMCKLTFEKFNIINLPRNEKFVMSVFKNNEMTNNFELLSNNQGVIDIKPIVNKRAYYNDLDSNHLPVLNSYQIIIQNEKINLENTSCIIKLDNYVTRKEVEIKEVEIKEAY